MSRVFRPGLAVAVLVLSLGVAAVGLAAPGKRRHTCDARPGKTVSEDAAVRVYRAGGHDFACARPGAKAYLLMHAMPDPNQGVLPKFLGHVQLAGGFVAWEEFDGTGAVDIIVLDVEHGTYRSAGHVISDVGERIVAFVLSAKQTVVWIAHYPEYESDSVYEHAPQAESSHGQIVLDQGAPGSVGSLAFSNSGQVAYWTDDGVAKSAQIH